MLNIPRKQAKSWTAPTIAPALSQISNSSFPGTISMVFAASELQEKVIVAKQPFGLLAVVDVQLYRT